MSGWRIRLKGFLGRLDENYEADEVAESRGRSRSNLLLDRIAAEVERVMRAEMLAPPGEPIYIPPEYLIFLSPDDDRELRGEKRTGFLRGLRNATAQAAGRLVGGKAQTDKLFVAIKSDGSLAPGEFKVKAVWETQEEATQVQARPVQGGSSTRPEEDEEETRVRAPRAVDASARSWTILVEPVGGGPPREHPITSTHFTIGRGGRSAQVDLQLPEDIDISRHHLSLHLGEDGQVLVEVVGRNPVHMGEEEIEPGTLRDWPAGESLLVGKYRLRLTRRLAGPGS